VGVEVETEVVVVGVVLVVVVCTVSETEVVAVEVVLVVVGCTAAGIAVAQLKFENGGLSERRVVAMVVVGKYFPVLLRWW
jgi:hypothetical protein